MVRETRGSDLSVDTTSTISSPTATRSPTETVATSDTAITRYTTISPNDDFTRVTFFEIHSSPTNAPGHEYQFRRFSDDHNPEIPEAAKSLIKQWLAQISAHQTHLKDLEPQLRDLQTAEAALQEQITTIKKTMREAKNRCNELMDTDVIRKNVSSDTLKNLRAKSAENSFTEFDRALQNIKKELKDSTRSMRQEKASLKQQVRAIEASTRSDGSIDNEFLSIINRDHQLDAVVMHDLDTHPPARTDQTHTQAETNQAFSQQRDSIKEQYETARHALLEQLNINGLFEEMSKRQAERGEQRQAEIQSITTELTSLQENANRLQNKYNQIRHWIIINKLKDIATSITEQETISKLIYIKDTIKQQNMTGELNDTVSDKEQETIDKLKNRATSITEQETIDKLKNIEDIIKQQKDLDKLNETVISDKGQKIIDKLKGITDNIKEQEKIDKLKDRAASIKAAKTEQDERILKLTSADDYPPSLEKLPAELHDDVKHILDEMRRRQETRDHYLAIIDQEDFLPAILDEIESEAPLYHALQVEQAPNETTDAFHQRLMDSLPRDVPEHIQQTEHWQHFQLTYDEFVRTNPPTDAYVQMKQDVLSSLKQYLLTRNELSTHLQKIEEWRRAERELPHIQQEILTILVDHLSASSLKKLSPEAQTKIRAMSDDRQPTSTASKVYQEIPDTDQEKMRAHLTQEVETEAPLSAALQRLTERPPFHQMEEAYHEWLIQHLPPNVPEPIQRTTEWQTLLLTYPDYVNTYGAPNPQHYIWMKREALTNLKDSLQAGNQHLMHPQGIEVKQRAEQDRVKIQQEIVNLLSDPSLQKLSQKVREQLENIRKTNEASAPSQELTNEQLQLIYQIRREIATETRTHLALQFFTSESFETPDACHQRLVELLPHNPPQHIRQTDQWKPLHLTYAEYAQSHPQAPPDSYITMKLAAAMSLKQDLERRNQLLTHLERLRDQTRKNQEHLQTFQQRETEAPLYLALQHLTTQPVPDQMGKAYQGWIAKQLPKEIPEHIQQTDQWQQVQQTYTDYVRSHPQSLPDHYVQVKDQALRRLETYLQNRNQLPTRLQQLEQSRTAHQNMLETDQWSTLNRQADTLLQQLSTTSGSNRDTWSILKRNLGAYIETKKNSPETEELSWDHIAQQGQEIHGKSTTSTELGQALLHAHDTHPVYRALLTHRLQNIAALTGIPLEQRRDLDVTDDQPYQFAQTSAAIENTPLAQRRVFSTLTKRWEHQFSRIATVLTDIPLEQRRVLSKISTDNTRTPSERFSLLERELSKIRKELQTRIKTLENEITANESIVAELAATIRPYREKTKAHKEKEIELQEKQEKIRETTDKQTTFEQDIATAQTHITTTQANMDSALDTIVEQEKQKLQVTQQKTKEKIRRCRRIIAREFKINLDGKAPAEFLKALVDRDNQYSKALKDKAEKIAAFNEIIADNDQVLRDLGDPENSLYQKYSEDFINSLQSKIDENTARVTTERTKIVNFSNGLDLSRITAKVTKPKDEIAVDPSDITTNIPTMEDNFLAEINRLNEQNNTSYSSLNNLGVGRYFTESLSLDDEAAFFTEQQERIAKESTDTRSIEYILWQYYSTISRQLATCMLHTKILAAKKKEHDRMQRQANEQKSSAETSKLSLETEQRKIQDKQPSLKPMLDELQSYVNTRDEENNRFEAWSKQIAKVREEIAALYSPDAE